MGEMDSDHRAALAEIPAAQMAELVALSDRPGLVRLGVHLCLIGALAALVLALDGWARLAAQAALGLPLVFLFTPMHEATHRTAFRAQWLNDWVARVAGVLLVLPALSFRYFHLAHHRFTQDPERDPELATPKPATTAAYFWALSGVPYWTGQVRSILGAALGRPLPAHVPPRAEDRVRREARLHLALYATLAVVSVKAGSTVLLTLWVVPALLGMPWLRAFLMAEHTGCPLVPDMLANTRTTFTHRLVRWIGWEMPWHTAHHAAPQVPFHRLPALSAALERRLRSTADGYADAHRQIRRGLS